MTPAAPNATPPRHQHLVLLGGGHAQVQVVTAFAAAPPPNTSITLINRSRLTPYSGMLPGLIAGHYHHSQCHIDLAKLCRSARIEFVEQEATGLDLAERYVHCANGSRYRYDLLSVDTGSTPPLDLVAGARAHALGVKPIETFLIALDALIDQARAAPAMALAVVGAGAAGVEVILALDHCFQQHFGKRPRPKLHLLTDATQILVGFNARVRRAAARILATRGISIHTGAQVRAVDANGVLLASGEHIALARAMFVTGAAAHPMFARAGLATDPRGFITVHATLQSVSHPNVFASGDIAHVPAHPRPKAGVFAVRQGPPLADNLRRALQGEALRDFVPQQRFLVILSGGDKYAIATRGDWAIEGRWVWRWKDWIDQRFMARFR